MIVRTFYTRRRLPSSMRGADKRKGAAATKQIILFSCFAVLLAFGLPLLLYIPGGSAPEPTAPPVPTAETADTAAAAPAAVSALPVLDAGIPLAVLTDSGVETMSMAEYLPLALAGEMPASFEPEALKAQAVALRTYALFYRAQRKTAHPDSDVCTDPGCCAAAAKPDALREAWGSRCDEYAGKLADAVRDTDGQYLVWEDAPALTVFHASSAARTENGAALGVDRRYLVSVDTPETAERVRNLCSTVEVSAEEFAASVRSVCPEADLSGAPENWVGPVRLDGAGRVSAAEIGGAALSGLALRQLFSLRSTDFTLGWSDGRFIFRVRGSGHGLGMSQYGANLLAQDGADYAAILSHYYPGTELVIAMRN